MGNLLKLLSCGARLRSAEDRQQNEAICNKVGGNRLLSHTVGKEGGGGLHRPRPGLVTADE